MKKLIKQLFADNMTLYIKKPKRFLKLPELERLLDTNEYSKINSDPISQQKTNKKYNSERKTKTRIH